MIRSLLVLTCCSLLFASNANAQKHRRDAPETAVQNHGPLKRIYFNPYTDSLKPVLNFYVNVEGEYGDGRILPMDTSLVQVTADAGEMAGMEWLVRPGMPRYEKVTFTATARENPALRDQITVWMKKAPDPADAEILRQTPSGRR